MKREQTFRSLQSILVFLAGILSVIFLLVLVPMTIHLHNLNNTALSQKEELTRLVKEGSIDINHSLRSQQNYLNTLEKQINEDTTNLLKYIQLSTIPENILRKMKSPDFSLDYFNGTRNEIAANITKLAADKAVALGETILAGEPQAPQSWFQSQFSNTPQLYELWLDLISYERIVTSLIGAVPSKIDAVTINPYVTDKKSTLTNMIQIPVNVVFTGTTESVVQFLKDLNNKPRTLSELLSPPKLPENTPAPEPQPASEQPAQTQTDTPTPEAAPADNPTAEAQPAPETAETPAPEPETKPASEQPTQPQADAPAPEAAPADNPTAEAQPTPETAETPAPEPEPDPEPDPKHFSIFLDSFMISIAPTDPNLVIFRGTVSCMFDITPLIGDYLGGKQK